MRRGLGTSRITLNIPISKIIRVPEGEEEEQEIENLFEKIMENFSNLAKEINFQEVQEAQRVPKKLDPRRNTPRHIIKLPKTKNKEKILKAARETESYLQRSSHKTISLFLKRNLADKKGLERSIPSHERQGPTSKIYCIQQSYHLEWKGR